MSNVPVQLVIAAFRDQKSASDALKVLKLVRRERLIGIQNAAVLRKDDQGKLHITETADMGGGKGAVLGGVTGAAIGLIAGPALLVPAAVGALVVGLALNLLPFAGIAFLWFIGVIRDRLGQYEDRFFSTVFLGSGLLFLAMLFASGAIAGGLIRMYGTAPATLVESGIYTFGRTVTYEIMNLYTMKMAGVFMISACTLSLRTGIIPRWMTLTGYACALFLLVSLGFFSWAPLVFPLWVLLISVYILQANLKIAKIETAAGD